MYEHKNKLVEGFTAKYNVNKLVYFEHTANIRDAITIEKSIKGWARSKKNAFVSESNPCWDDLSDELSF